LFCPAISIFSKEDDPCPAGNAALFRNRFLKPKDTVYGMKQLFIVRHTESEANKKNILASQIDFPLSDTGTQQAVKIADAFFHLFSVDRIISSPLLRAYQTATYFAQKDQQIAIEKNTTLIEQNLGIFSGMAYAELETRDDYCHDRSQRWNWIPEGGGESYRMVAKRAASFFTEIEKEHRSQSILIVTHAVTMRLIRAILEATLPIYPDEIPANGEIWEVHFRGSGFRHNIKSHLLANIAHTGKNA
jgi:broad specificity phosphatase PhoE